MLRAKFYINGRFLEGENYDKVINKFDGSVIGEYPVADGHIIGMAISAAAAEMQAIETMPSHKRADILDFISASLKEAEAKLAEIIALEAGKPIKQALVEVRRTQQTFKFAAACARNIEGASIRLDSAIGSEQKYGFYLKVPVGIVVAISPFNFPLNLVAHKIAPAIAAGCPVILKPASYTPLTAYFLAEIISKSGLPAGGFALLYGPGSGVGMSLVRDENVRAVTFTGSPEIGLEIAKNAGIKRLVLELGSNSAVIVDDSADLEFAIPGIVAGAYYYSGQVCISVQRIYVAERIYQDFIAMFLEKTKSIVSGNPLDEKTEIGPMITENESKRVESWVNEAVSSGAKILIGGKRHGSFYEPTILIDTSPDMKVVSREIFGPVACVMPFRHFDDAINMVNDSIYGLQAGVFTRNIDSQNKAIHNLKVGGVIINDVPTYRSDNMPYGGVKLSGLGREGLKYAIDELTDIRMIVIQR